MAYNTNNPVGSTDPRDLYDNAGNLDKFVNGDVPFYPDRLGQQRKSWSGMEADFASAQEGREAAFEQLLEASAFIWIGDYGTGLTFTSRSQYTVRDGYAYRLSQSTTIPYTSTGNWALEQAKFSLVNSDDILRQDLNGAGGATFVGRGSSTVDADLAALEFEQVSQNHRLDAGGFPIKIYDAVPANPPLYTPYMIVLPPDVTKPVMTGFALQNNQYNPVPITTLTATDDRGVTGWWIGHSSAVPTLSDSGWSTSKPATFTTTGTGLQTVYARARDAAGNISDPLSSTVTVLSKAYQDIWWPGDIVSSAGYAVRGGGADQAWCGMKFVMPATRSIDTIQLKLFSVKNTTYPGSANVLVQIRTGSYTGTVVAESNVLDFNDGTYQTRTATLSSPVTLTSGVTYYLTVTVNVGTALTGDTLYRIYVDTAQTGEIGTKFNSNAWATSAGLTPLRLGVA